ncbi:MAG: lipid II:glycine glycyltransferase FemX [Patescibacteria group bacterium]
MTTHVVQSPEWGEFKTKYGTKAIRVGGVQYTLHRLPYTYFNYAYAPKVNPKNINWEKLMQSLKAHNCFAINFDAPNVIKGSAEEKQAKDIFEERCKKAHKNTFTKYNILLDLTTSENELLENMHKKHRYNIKYAQKKGVIGRVGISKKDFETFFNLFKETADRQKYHIHPKKYYEKIWELLTPKGMCHIVFTEYKNEPLAAWMLFTYENVLYYPYGGSSDKHRNLQGSSLIGWEAIKFGKSKNCKLFDMWGAAKDPNDEQDPEFGFTNFKLKFGGNHVEYMSSYDLVLNPILYYSFNTLNTLRWKLLRAIK